MHLEFRQINQDIADAIVAWHYEEPYTFYDQNQDEEDLEEFLNPENWPHGHYSAHDKEGQLVGSFFFEMKGEILTIGLGLRPDLTGRGIGINFINAGIEFAKQKYNPTHLCLSVATFNKRAIKAYQKAGFEKGEVFLQKTNGGEYEFLRMSRPA
jgi:ribosomal-protein-alanine N-acetyltransferase